MVEFLNTSGISNNLEELIRNSKDELYLISPYIKIGDNIRQIMREKDLQSVTTTVVYKKINKQDKDNLIFLKELENCKFYILKSLHAKCYLNENAAIVTSMNLHESSKNNWEMGIKIEKNSDPDLYNNIYNEVMLIIQQIQPPIKNVEVNTSNSNGFCIRCGADLVLNREKPMCLKCYKTMKKYKGDNNRKFRYCHYCGKQYTGTVEKPVCDSCYRKLSK